MVMRQTRTLPGFLGATNPWLITAVEKVTQLTNESEKSK